MKLFIAKILVKILNKMDCTVIIGCKIDGDITCIRDNQFFYNNELSNGKTFSKNGQSFELPDGKFTLKSTFNEETNMYTEWYRKVVNKKKK